MQATAPGAWGNTRRIVLFAWIHPAAAAVVPCCFPWPVSSVHGDLVSVGADNQSDQAQRRSLWTAMATNRLDVPAHSRERMEGGTSTGVVQILRGHGYPTGRRGKEVL